MASQEHNYGQHFLEGYADGTLPIEELKKICLRFSRENVKTTTTLLSVNGNQTDFLHPDLRSVTFAIGSFDPSHSLSSTRNEYNTVAAQVVEQIKVTASTLIVKEQVKGMPLSDPAVVLINRIKTDPLYSHLSTESLIKVLFRRMNFDDVKKEVLAQRNSAVLPISTFKPEPREPELGVKTRMTPTRLRQLIPTVELYEQTLSPEQIARKLHLSVEDVQTVLHRISLRKKLREA